MRLVHFSDKDKIEFRKYPLRKDHETMGGVKPHGLWVSDEDDFGWREWCEGEQFNLCNLKNAHSVRLKESSRILFIRNDAELEAFNDKYGKSSELLILKVIDWKAVRADGFQGIIITPYLWNKRLDHNVFWYYGWDCASGCIWDMDAIEKIELI